MAESIAKPDALHSFVVTAAKTATANLIAVIGGNLTVKNSEAQNAIPVGVFEFAGVAGERVNVVTAGMFPVKVSGTLPAAGDFGIAADDGTVIKMPASTGTYNVLGVFLEAPAAAGDHVTMLIAPRSVEVVA